MNLGSGNPTNGIRYQNADASDFGVNQDGLGNLRGYAYGANIGWINFEESGAPKVDLKTGKLSGTIWSANCGWISLSNSVAFVQTDTISPGSLAPNGLPNAWLLSHFGTINIDPDADPDGDGMSNAEEYIAGTSPTSRRESLQIVGQTVDSEGTTSTLTWTSVATRSYRIQYAQNLDAPSTWTDSSLGLIDPDGSLTTRHLSAPDAAMRFFRIQAVRLLSR
jgi:hypothetical protein